MADLERACQRLVRMNYLYPNYRLCSRGPQGMQVDLLKELWPELAEAVEEFGWDLAYTKFFDSDTGVPLIRIGYRRPKYPLELVLALTVFGFIASSCVLILTYVIWKGTHGWP